MKSSAYVLAVAAVACAVLGCVPRRLFWSPDGRYGAVIGAQGLYLTTPDGKLSKLVAPRVGLVAWFKDSKRFVAARSEGVPDWKTASTVISKERQAALIAMAQPLRAEILAYEGEWKDFHSRLESSLTPGEFAAVILYVRDHDDGKLAAKLADQWQEAKQGFAMLTRLQVYEVADGEPKAGKVIYSGMDGPVDMRISPDGKTLAATFQVNAGGSPPMCRLVVMPISGDWPMTVVAERTSHFPDFSADGEYLYYGSTRDMSFGVKAAEGEKDASFTLGTLSRRRILDLNGGILSPLPDQEDLVGVLFWHQMKVRCLEDGRVLFSSGEVKLPITTAEMPQHPSLFSIDPARQPTVTRMLPAEVDDRIEGLSQGEFELSPDQQRIVVVGSGSKGVTVITLAAGKIETLFPPQESSDSAEVKDLASMPAWRTANELSILVQPGSKGGLPDKTALLQYTLDGKGRCINKDWPELFAEPAATGPSQ